MPSSITKALREKVRNIIKDLNFLILFKFSLVFPCPVCRKEFSRPDKMKNHMKMTHECYMPKECKFPIPLLMQAGSSQQSAPIAQPMNNNNVVATSQ